MSLTGVYSIEEKLQYESDLRDADDGLKDYLVVDHSPQSPREWPRARHRSPSAAQNEPTPRAKHRAPPMPIEPETEDSDTKNKKSAVKMTASASGEAAGDGKLRYRFKLNDKMRKKLQKQTPIISGHTLEHFYRYGKPPFMNFGYKRNVRLTRY